MGQGEGMQQDGHTRLVATSGTVLVSPGCQWAWIAHVPHFIFTLSSSVSTLLEQEFQVCLGSREMQCHHPTCWILVVLAAAAAAPGGVTPYCSKQLWTGVTAVLCCCEPAMRPGAA